MELTWRCKFTVKFQFIRPSLWPFKLQTAGWLKGLLFFLSTVSLPLTSFLCLQTEHGSSFFFLIQGLKNESELENMSPSVFMSTSIHTTVVKVHKYNTEAKSSQHNKMPISAFYATLLSYFCTSVQTRLTLSMAKRLLVL